MMNIAIKQVAIYHPENSISNDVYIKHFQEKGKAIERFLEVMGRESRYVITDEEENGFTMGVEAAKRALQKANFSGEDIDLIVFSTQVPETTFPTNALLLHDAIQAGKNTIVLDSNANCAGMTVAVEQASRYMQANPHVKTALIVGSDYNTLISNPEDEITYANYGDAAACVILEKTDKDCGFQDAIYFTDSVNREKIMYPAKGLSHTLRGTGDDKYIQWLPFDGNMAMPPTYEMLHILLERNQLTARDINAYCFSQFALVNIMKIKKQLQIADSQVIYIGDRFGYTGTSSPFIALHEGIETGRIKRGDYVVFWTIGSGYQLVAMLFKY